MCLKELITGMEKPQIVHWNKRSKELNDFSVLFYGFKWTEWSDGFHVGLENHRRRLQTSAFHGTMALIVMALSPLRGLEGPTYIFPLFFDVDYV